MPPPVKSSGDTKIDVNFEEILTSNGILDKIDKVDIKPSGAKGEGFASQTSYVAITFQGDREPLNLFIKTHVENLAHRQMVDETKLFEKESTFFMKYLPEANKLCSSKGQPDLIKSIYPKCYYGDENIMVFENLVLDKGYVLLDSTTLQDFETAKLAILNLAKHHAISYAMIMESGGSEKFLERYPVLGFEVFGQPAMQKLLEPMMENGIKTNLNILEKYSHIEGVSDAVRIMNKYVGKAYSNFKGILIAEQLPRELRTLNHGDYHNNNMMFLIDPATNAAISHLAIDLQVTRYNSPTLDLGVYLQCSVQTDVRRTHLKKILEIYLDALKETADSLGYPIDTSFDEFFDTYRNKFKLGFWLGIGFATGKVARAATKEINLETMEDLSDWPNRFNAFVAKWIEENPEEGEEIAKVIVDLFKEYNDLANE